MATFLSNFTQVVGIDLGSSMVRIWTPKLGVIVKEPAFLAVDSTTKKSTRSGYRSQIYAGESTKGC